MATGFVLDWSLHFHKRGKDGSGKCNIFPDGDGIHVAVYDISAADKLVLDKIEGLGSGYSETLLSVPDIGDCVSYIAEESYVEDSSITYDWYKELVLLGASAHGFPDDYLNRIRSLPQRQDPDTARRLKRWKTVELVRAGGY
ncbi:MAG: gamma-glutamylcyclotransferase [Gammaproteobacteria bacterium]|nr:gamma-glutamylcyclotransferase [Gammaproteobacteria bacterium]